MLFLIRSFTKYIYDFRVTLLEQGRIFLIVLRKSNSLSLLSWFQGVLENLALQCWDYDKNNQFSCNKNPCKFICNSHLFIWKNDREREKRERKRERETGKLFSTNWLIRCLNAFEPKLVVSNSTLDLLCQYQEHKNLSHHAMPALLAGSWIETAHLWETSLPIGILARWAMMGGPMSF